MNIPVVDLADFLSGDKSRKQKFVQELGKAYEEVGFVAVKNHGIPDDLIADLYKYVQQFFALPSDTNLQTKFIPIKFNYVEAFRFAHFIRFFCVMRK